VWQGFLGIKNDQAAVQMYYVTGHRGIAQDCLRTNLDGSTSPLRIMQRMRLEHNQLEGVTRKMQVCEIPFKWIEVVDAFKLKMVTRT